MMRSGIVKTVLIGFIIIAFSIPSIEADAQIVLPHDSATTLHPIGSWNITPYSDDIDRLSPRDVAVSTEGVVYSVNMRTDWELIRGPSPTSFVAWKTTGEVLWSKVSSTWDLQLFGVTTDDSHVYVTGQREGLFIGKYDLLGNCVWNNTYNLGNFTCGLRISVSEDGYIIVRGTSSGRFSNFMHDEYLAVLNLNGEIIWNRSFEGYSFVTCDSSFIYILENNVLEKFTCEGTNVWSTGFSEETRLAAHDDLLYSHPGTEHIEESIFSIGGWDLSNGAKQWSYSITLYNSSNQLYNVSRIYCSTAQNGSLVVLLRGSNHSPNGWRLLVINEEGYPTRHFSILDTSWSSAFCEMTDSGQLIVVGLSSNTGFTMAIYDSLGPVPSYSLIISEPLDVFIIGATLIGVVVFDASLIIFLKKRYVND